jgi:isoprenylcysteine carboxyl methyltransferase (ICMT) family protein YpbQ
MQKKQTKISSETGHVDILFVTLFASILVVIMMIGLKNDNDIFAWVGGIGTALMLIVQFALVHNELGRLWAKIDELENK